MVQNSELDKCSCRRSGIIPSPSFVLLTVLLRGYYVIYIDNYFISLGGSLCFC